MQIYAELINPKVGEDTDKIYDNSGKLLLVPYTKDFGCRY